VINTDHRSLQVKSSQDEPVRAVLYRSFWSMADHMRSSLVCDALKQALHKRCPPSRLIFHSNRGSQFGISSYRQLLTQAEIRQSISARANPYHNAWTESFIGILKKRNPSERRLHQRTRRPNGNSRLHQILLQYPSQTLWPQIPFSYPIRCRNHLPMLSTERSKNSLLLNHRSKSGRKPISHVGRFFGFSIGTERRFTKAVGLCDECAAVQGY